MMSRFSPYSGLAGLRRLTALLAVLGLVYAAGFATLAHGLAMPMTMPAAAAQASHDTTHDAPAHDHAAIAQHDHAAMADMSADDPAPSPCDSGCALCKDCALCLFTGLPATAPPSAALRYTDYRALPRDARSGILPALPTEPPRV